MGEKAKLDAVSDVEIDAAGKFKYVLIKATIGDHSKHLVRGFCDAEWHSDVYDNTWQRLEPLGIDTECLGGGRILHEPDKKHIRVYGYSQATVFNCGIGFGKADHRITVDLLKKKYPNYTNIEWSDEGY